jgi:hypothetical protein
MNYHLSDPAKLAPSSGHKPVARSYADTVPAGAARRLAVAVAVVFGAIQFPAATAAAVEAGAQVRTDGIYYLVHPGGAKNAEGAVLCVGVRFYADQTAIETEFYGDPAGLTKWFNRDNETLLPGRWVLSGEALTVTLGMAFQEKTRTGGLAAEGWRINERIVFRFVQLNFPDASAAPGKNRRPYFIGPGKGVTSLDYDPAGRPIGINEEVEIQAVDPDGDPLKFTWTVSNGTLAGDGPKVVWKRIMLGGSRPGTVDVMPGVISVEVSDGKGGKIFAQNAN